MLVEPGYPDRLAGRDRVRILEAPCQFGAVEAAEKWLVAGGAIQLSVLSSTAHSAMFSGRTIGLKSSRGELVGTTTTTATSKRPGGIWEEMRGQNPSLLTTTKEKQQAHNTRPFIFQQRPMWRDTNSPEPAQWPSKS